MLYSKYGKLVIQHNACSMTTRKRKLLTMEEKVGISYKIETAGHGYRIPTTRTREFG